mgnify:CR=1 FL=1
MEDKRKDSRLPVEAHPDESSTGNTYIEVIDTVNGQVVGYIEDLSAHGLRVIGPHPVERDKLLTVQLSLSEQIDGCDSIELSVRSAWTQKDPLSNMHRTGFRLESVSDDDQLVLTSLLRQIAERVRHEMAAKLE